MCGITGFVSSKPLQEAELLARVCRMAEQLIHRGPDDAGAWVDAEAGVALGFRRLSIIDLSPEGHQPMLSESGRYVMVFNGEVYNFQELRRELEPRGSKFRGHSDTEVMLAAISTWGLEAAVKKFVGMFAFAVWDRRERVLHLVRDRVGIKPLYYGWAGKTFLFASELKALRLHPDFVPEVDRGAIALQMRYNYIPQPFSIYRGIFKLRPGCILTLTGRDFASQGAGSLDCYWSAREVAERGAAETFTGTEREAADELEALLRQSVRLRMVADVPLGAFLSGGIDSSTVVALMQAESTQPVKTFTIGFYEDEFSEAVQAKAVAEHLGTDHTELYLTPKEAMDVIPKLPTLYDEPFSDASQLPTYLVARLARRSVTVSLSGDGGDELFGGYNRYLLGLAVWKKIRKLPKSLRAAVAWLLRRPSLDHWDRLLAVTSALLPSRYRVRVPGDKVYKLADIISVRDPREFYRGLVSHWRAPGTLVLGAQEPPTFLSDLSEWAKLGDFSQLMMFLDLVTYLPDDILVKVDRATMGVSLEGRVPLLDHRVVEFAMRLPMSMKIRNEEGKLVLRQVLYRYVPRHLIERPKMGFDVPVGRWLCGPLREWAEELLSESRLRREGFFQPGPIRKCWEEHVSGRWNWTYHLWVVLMFQTWLEQGG